MIVIIFRTDIFCFNFSRTKFESTLLGPSRTFCHVHTSLSPSDEDFSIDATAVHKGAKKVIIIVCKGQISYMETIQIDRTEF
jgi:hypothetical protein